MVNLNYACWIRFVFCFVSCSCIYYKKKATKKPKLKNASQWKSNARVFIFRVWQEYFEGSCYCHAHLSCHIVFECNLEIQKIGRSWIWLTFHLQMTFMSSNICYPFVLWWNDHTYYCYLFFCILDCIQIQSGKIDEHNSNNLRQNNFVKLKKYLL